MAEGDALQQFFGGVRAGSQKAESDANLQLKAVDLHRKQEELQGKKLEIGNAKHQRLLNLTLSVANSEGKIQELHKKQARAFTSEMGMPVNDDYWDVVGDGSMRGALNQAIGDISGVDDPEKFAELMEQVTPFTVDPLELSTGLAQFNADMASKKASAKATAAGKDKTGEKIDKIVTDFAKDKRIERLTVMEESMLKMEAAVAGRANPTDKAEIADYLRQGGVRPSKVTAFDDITLIINFMRMNDPTSVVREGEFRTAAAAGSLAQKFTVWANSIIGGAGLEKTQRAQIINASRKSVAAAKLSADKTFRNALNRAIATGVSPQKVAIGLGRALPKGFVENETLVQALVKGGMTEDAARSAIFKRAQERRNEKTKRKPFNKGKGPLAPGRGK